MRRCGRGLCESSNRASSLLVFERGAGRERLRCTFNLSDRPATFTKPGRKVISIGDIDEGSLGPYAAMIEEIG